MEMNEELQGKMMQFQQLQQQVQVLASQKYQIDMQVSEIEKTLEELGKAKKDAPIYKSIGSLLIRNDDKEGLVKELEEQKETLEVRVKTLEKQEKVMREQHQSLQDELTQALQDQQQTT